MVLALALALAGLNPEEFTGLIAKFSPDCKLSGAVDYPSSPSSRSESSGIGSAAPSIKSLDGGSPWSTPFTSRTPSVRSSNGSTPLPTPTSSRPNTPLGEFYKNDTVDVTPLLEIAKKRDLLDLGAHLKNSRWEISHPLLPLNDFHMYMANKSVYHRVSERGLKEDYPTRRCDDCDFTEPSPYAFGAKYEQPIPPGRDGKTIAVRDRSANRRTVQPLR